MKKYIVNEEEVIEPLLNYEHELKDQTKRSKYNYRNHKFVFDSIFDIEEYRKVYVQIVENTQDMAFKLFALLKLFNFDKKISKICGKNDLIVIKPNFAPISHLNYHYYTNPSVVNAVVDYLIHLGYTNIKIAEAQTNAILAYSELNPTNLGNIIGYKLPIFDLTKDTKYKVYYDEKSYIEVSELMLNANVIINMPKPKNHDLMFFTASLKNMYGSIPTYNKYRQFHKKESGLSIEKATFLINHTTPSHFIIGDWVDSVDGNEKSYFRKELTSYNHFQSKRLFISESMLSVDKYVATKMGYLPEESPIIAEEIKNSSDFKIDNLHIIGDNLDVFNDWKRISWDLHLRAKLQDKIPVSDKMIGDGIRSYKFPIIKK